MAKEMELLSESQPRPKRPWRQRLLRGIVIYFVVAFLTSFLGLNLLGAIIFSGPLMGRVVDADGKGIPGAFVSYEWRGQELHGSSGCKAAALVRSGSSGYYFVPWQGWRLLFVTGWGISPAGPAVWTPGYVELFDPRGGHRWVPEGKVRPTDQLAQPTSVDKGACFGWTYHTEWVELRATRFALQYKQVCGTPRSTRISEMNELVGTYLNLLLSREGSSLADSPGTEKQVEPLRSQLERAAYPRQPNAEDAVATSEQSDSFCRAINAEYLASGGKVHEQ